MSFLKGYLATTVFIFTLAFIGMFVLHNFTVRSRTSIKSSFQNKIFDSDGFASRIAREISKQGSLVIDVRTQTEFEQGHENEAVHIWLKDFQRSLNWITTWENKNFNAPIIVYSNNGDRAANAKKLLTSAGFNNVAVTGLKQKNQACCL